MKLAEIQTINEITPIEGADRIVLAKVQGWSCVVKKGDFNVGDRIIFVPIDTVLRPETWNSFLHDKNDPTKPIRVKTVKLKNQISQGLIFPLSILENYGSLIKDGEELDVGVDISSILNISKYEKPIPAHLAGQVAGDFPSHLVSKTDEDNLKSNIEVLDELKEADFVEATIKYDGTSATYIKELDSKFRVCSRNLELKDTEDNIHWQMARKYNIMENLNSGYAIQGEINGIGVQGNPAGFDEVWFNVFNVIDLSSRKPLHRDSWHLAFIDIPHVFKCWSWNKEEFAKENIDSLQNFVNDLKFPNGRLMEGLVFRGIKDGKIMYSHKLQKMLSVKIINQNYKD